MRNSEDAAALQPVLDRLSAGPSCLDGTLETPDDLEQLYQVLEAARGCDGRPAVFSAFMPMGNPDYAAIAASDFQEYHDIGLDEGLPPNGERDDLIGKRREGVTRGVFAPEFHAGLHHISPILWLELLRGDDAEAQVARDFCVERLRAKPALARISSPERQSAARLGEPRHRAF